MAGHDPGYGQGYGNAAPTTGLGETLAMSVEEPPDLNKIMFEAT